MANRQELVAVDNTGGALTVTDGTAAHGKLIASAVATAQVRLFGNSGDANEQTILYPGVLYFGPGGGSGVDVSIFRTGTSALKILANTTDSLGFLGATPVTRQANTIDLATVLSNFGFRASGGNPPLNLGTGALTAGALTATGAVSLGSSGQFDVDTSGNVTTTGTLTAGRATFQLGFNSQVGTTYTMVLSDAGALIRMGNASASTLTIPANSSVAFPIGTIIYFAIAGAGGLTLAITTDTLTGTTAYPNNTGGYIIKRATTAWIAFKCA